MFVALLLAGLMAIDGEAIAGDPAWLRDVSFMAYTPSEFKVINGKPIPASPESIAEDLQVLRPYADGLITYSVAN